jgi:hypothetical protein
MLVYAARQLGASYSSPSSGMGDEDSNIALESFLLHFRNLRVFLFPLLQNSVANDDVLASDYLGKSRPQNIGTVRAFHADKDGLDQMLAHLSYNRDSFIRAGKAKWRVARMTAELIHELELFLSSLAPKAAAMFPIRKLSLAADREFFSSVAQLEEPTSPAV